MEDNQSDSYDESKLQTIRKQIQIPKTQLIQLAYNEQKLLKKIDMLNHLGLEHINRQQFYQAIIYLNQAQNALEYAAGCGRTIDRVLIITTLHNQASVYQRIWELNKSSVYIEAIIYNITSFLSNQSTSSLSPDIAIQNSTAYNKFSTCLNNKLQLISYQLQYCAVSSQIKNHENALNSAQKALSLLKNYCQQIHIYEKLIGYNGNSYFQKHLLFDLQNIRDFQNQCKIQMNQIISKLIYKCKKSIIVFQKKMLSNNIGLSSQELKQLQNFSLGQLMQMSPLNVQKLQEKFDINQQLIYFKKIFKAIYISISHFTIATELRLIASQLYSSQANIKKQSQQFKQSQIHHLIAIITIALYVPCHTKYFQHILTSFKNHYQLDLTQIDQSQFSQDRVSRLKDDLIHLEIQSISQNQQNQQKISDNLRSSNSKHKRFIKQRSIKDKNHNKTILSNTFLASQNSESTNLKKKLNKKSHSKQKSQKKQKKHLLTQNKNKQKRTIIHKQSRNKSKSKNNESYYKNKSRNSISESQQMQQNQKVVHYFKYDNFSKKVVKNKMKIAKQPGEYQLNKRIGKIGKIGKVGKDKKSSDNIIKNHMTNIQEISKTTQQYYKEESNNKTLKKGKTPDLNSFRSSHKYIKKIN